MCGKPLDRTIAGNGTGTLRTVGGEFVDLSAVEGV
jgi:hypothetical protein